MISTTDRHRLTRMKEAGTINFQGASDSDEAVAIVRYDEKSVAICISKASDGDMEVVLDKLTAKLLLEVLRKAVA